MQDVQRGIDSFFRILESFQTVSHIGFLLLSAAMIFWGLKIFKVYIILTGIAFGALTGMLTGALLAVFTDASQETIILLAVIGAIIFGFSAWPFQKVVAFIIVGSFAVLVGLSIMLITQTMPDSFLVPIAVLFIIGGVIGVATYEYTVIICMAFSAAQIIFSIAYAPQIFFGRGAYSGILQNVLNAVIQYAFSFMLMIALFILFSLYFQKWAKNRSERLNQGDSYNRLKRVSYILFTISVIGYGLNRTGSFFASGTVLQWVSISNWPVLAFITSAFALWILNRGGKEKKFLNSSAFRFLSLAAFSLIALPVIAWASDSVITMNHVRFTGYQLMMTGNTNQLAFQWISAALLFPGIIYLSALRNPIAQEEKIE